MVFPGSPSIVANKGTSITRDGFYIYSHYTKNIIYVNIHYFPMLQNSMLVCHIFIKLLFHYNISYTILSAKLFKMFIVGFIN